MAREEKPQRTLTPEETARRKAAIEGEKDPAKTVPQPPALQSSEHGGPVEGYASRLERAAKVPSPATIDYDRDGYPDSVVGRSGRNLMQRAQRLNRTRPNVLGAVNPRTGVYSGPYALGPDSYRQDQMGYRDRLRGRIAAANQLAEEEEEQADDPKLLAAARVAVLSHGSTGVPGGMTGQSITRPGRGPVAPGVKTGYTPLEQAIMAPKTPHTGFENKGALKSPGIAVPMALTPDTGGAGLVGPGGTIRHASFGTVPQQGTFAPDGKSFTVAEPAGAGTRDADKAKAGESGKPPEHGKPHETAKHEPAKHEPAKHDHTKHPEHHGKK